jgi:UDP-2,4-diacetamido-2,4,6-trideoxy-beta-L-altropyranose hydrolase
MTPRVAFRTDASNLIGAGHVTRALALAHQLRGLGSAVRFICRAHPGHLAEAIEEKGFPVHKLEWDGLAADRSLGAPLDDDALETARALKGETHDWLVTDHYCIDARWERAAAARAQRIAVIDDLANRPHDAALLIDQNLQSRPTRYQGLLPSTCTTLLGPRYALLRPGFAEAGAGRTPRDGSLRRVLACAGGTDPKDMLGRVLDTWELLDGERPALDLVVGRSSPNVETLRRRCAALSGCRLHVQAEHMACLMVEADLMVCAGGTVNWERCCLGLPALMMQTADNQTDNLVQLARHKTGFALGTVDEVEPSQLAGWLRRLATRPALLRRLGSRCRQLVDGHGALRVAVTMLADRLRLRRAQTDDGPLVWPWRNAEATRRYFSQPRPVALADHLDWWNRSLEMPTRWLAIAEVGARPVGVIRFDLEGDTATASIYLDPLLTGLGLGTRLIRASEDPLRSDFPQARRLRAVIDLRNRASISAFEAAGYRAGSDAWYRDW